MSDRFRVEPVDAQDPNAGYLLHDTLTGAHKRHAGAASAKDAGQRILDNEEVIPWERIHSYEFFISSISSASVEVWGHDEDGRKILPSICASLVRVGHDRRESVVRASIHRWLDAMGHAELPRLSDLDAEAERRGEAAAAFVAIPSVRTRPSVLAERLLVLA